MREKLSRHYRKLRAHMRAKRLVIALCLAIGASLGLTVVSLTIYKVGGFYRYDLSRPGYEKERKEISTAPTDVSYDTTSPLSQQGVDDFLKQLDEHRKNLESYNGFGNGGLTDEDLNLTGNEPSGLQ